MYETICLIVVQCVLLLLSLLETIYCCYPSWGIFTVVGDCKYYIYIYFVQIQGFKRKQRKCMLFAVC